MKTLNPIILDSKTGLYSLFNQPPYLAGMALPDYDEIWESLKDHEIKNIVCLTDNKAPYNVKYGRIFIEKKMKTQIDGIGPENPESEKKILQLLADKCVAEYKRGESLVAHCQGGTGRTGTILAAILVKLGYKLEDIYQAFETLNKLRGKGEHGWPESVWQKEVLADID